jgi:hypothetical protein
MNRNYGTGARSRNRESGKLCSTLMLFAWAVTIVWILFLMYCYAFGVFNQSKLNELVHTVEKDVLIAINYTESSFRDTLLHAHRHEAAVHDAFGATFSSQNHPSKFTDVSEHFQVIFSTDCSPYQDWQSIVLFHSATVVKQRGKITRIASGCDDTKAASLHALYRKLFPYYGIHFTPDFKRDEKTNKKCKCFVNF